MKICVEYLVRKTKEFEAPKKYLPYIKAYFKDEEAKTDKEWELSESFTSENSPNSIYKMLKEVDKESGDSIVDFESCDEA